MDNIVLIYILKQEISESKIKHKRKHTASLIFYVKNVKKIWTWEPDGWV